jgi:hypothetical protein
MRAAQVGSEAQRLQHVRGFSIREILRRAPALHRDRSATRSTATAGAAAFEARSV